MKNENNLKIWFASSILFTVFSIKAQQVEHSIFITANTSDVAKNQVLAQIVKDAQTLQNPTLLLLGNATAKENFQRSLNSQLEVIKGFGKDAIFTPGENEWYENGYQSVQKIEKHIQKNSKAKFHPDNGEPIKKYDLSENVVLITIDSQWFLEDWDNQIYINEKSEIKNRTLFFLEFENQIKKAQGKIKLIAIHHPIDTYSKQGLIRNTAGPSIQDFQNRQYRTLRRRLKTVARQAENVIFVSGHDKNLQYINNRVPQIISGAVGTTKGAKRADEGDFSSTKNGYARLDIDSDGKTSVHFFTMENGVVRDEFNTIIFKGGNEDSISMSNISNNFSSHKIASIYTKDETTKSGFYKALWGNHYREYYSKDVNAKTVVLDTLMGGLTPLKRGGGQQSKSLRLEDNTGKQFVMRALRKSTIKFLQANAFQDVYIGSALDGSVVDKFLADFYTTSHPYAPFAIGGLAEAIDVLHTNPELYYIPKQKRLGVYNDEFGDELYMIEEHVGDSQLELESFGKPKEILSTADILQEIHKAGKAVVDEPSYIRARLFDMLLGDWDRHEDQWRWALFKKEDGTEICRPIPRDRDQAFSKYDGTLIAFLTRAIPGLRKMQTYDVDLRSVKWFATSPYHLDLTIINSSEWAEWEKQGKHIQKELTDQIIEEAFKSVPPEIQGSTIADIKTKLKGRRGNLLKIANAYYQYLNKFEVITGTQKADDFKITRHPNGKTTIKINRKELGILDRTFSSDVTKEIWIYGLDGKDSFTVDGDGDHLIKLKIIGGKKNDTYDFKNTSRVKLYDYKSKENTIINKGSKKWLVDDYGINNYDHKKSNFNFNQLLPIIGANPDDGLKVGVLYNNTFHGIQRNPFTRKHVFSAAYYTATSGYDVSYKGEFSNIFHNWNFGVEGFYTSPNFATNFFGFGNETIYDNDVVDLDFNRTRVRKWKTAIALIYRGKNGGSFHFKPLIESFEVENTAGRFVNDPNNIPVNSSVFEKQTYGGAEIAYEFENKDNPAFPTLGLDVRLIAGYKTNIDNTSAENSFGYVKPEIAIDHKLTRSASLVLATKLSAELILGDNFEFYHAAEIGGINGLRGFRNQRFTGKQSFYQNIDLRMPLGGLRTSIIPIRFGLTGSFDYGRVWIADDMSKQWHNSYGGSLWVSGVEAITANLGYFSSSDGGRIVFALGFSF
ncbi:metallophosphatase [Flagellimonas aquimarina]|uniref:Metallophosphatase n=1 Tax=Flagellimonas aquimarina TaxID=2201895 RepID=A0A316LF33_9FLAO|nr:metallophosphatase [Allomuricauda koreensis]PWL38700.1 metallophosphatase [Allomuricauda koreensis]